MKRLHLGMRIIPTAGIVVLAVLLLGGCGGKGHLTTRVDELPRPELQPISATGYNHFVNANLLELFEAYPEALAEYEKALEYFPESTTIRTDYARLLFRIQRFPEALSQSLKVSPRTAEISLIIGDCYRLLDKPEAAIGNYRQTVELDPDNINAYWYLAGYYRQLGQNDSAIAAYYNLARLSDTYRIWQELGAMLGQEGRYGEALTAFSNSISLNAEKTNISSFLGLATTYDALDSLDEAQELLDRAIALDEFDIRIYRHMLAMYLARQDLDKAIPVSEKLVSLVPSDWTAQRRLGVLLYSDARLEQADSLFAERIEFGDDNVINHFYRGRIAIEQKRIADALAFMLTVIDKEKSFIDGWLNLGFVYRELDSLDKAIAVMREGFEYCEDDECRVRLLFAIGAAQERNGQFHEAVAAFQKLIAIDADHAPALNYLAYTLADRGEQLNYALELIERAIAIAPDNGAYIDSYAWVHFRLGNLDLALSQLKKAVILLDNDAVIYEHLGDVYKALGDREEAERQYNRALEIDPESITLEEKLKE